MLAKSISTLLFATAALASTLTVPEISAPKAIPVKFPNELYNSASDFCAVFNTACSAAAPFGADAVYGCSAARDPKKVLAACGIVDLHLELTVVDRTVAAAQLLGAKVVRNQNTVSKPSLKKRQDSRQAAEESGLFEDWPIEEMNEVENSLRGNFEELEKEDSGDFAAQYTKRQLVEAVKFDTELAHVDAAFIGEVTAEGRPKGNAAFSVGLGSAEPITGSALVEPNTAILARSIVNKVDSTIDNVELAGEMKIDQVNDQVEDNLEDSTDKILAQIEAEKAVFAKYARGTVAEGVAHAGSTA